MARTLKLSEAHAITTSICVEMAHRLEWNLFIKMRQDAVYNFAFMTSQLWQIYRYEVVGMVLGLTLSGFSVGQRQILGHLSLKAWWVICQSCPRDFGA